MQTRLIRATAIKPELIRFSVELSDDDENLIAEYEIVLHTSDFSHVTVVDDQVQVETNTDALKERLTEEITKMTLTAGIARVLSSVGMTWEINETIPNDTDSQDTETNTGDNSTTE